ncbi:uncharacterized protein [Drosophila pseudoobscura]|uniref:Uncharacterized protein isoform X2 n=1 Tax=Drosophila pseudoobscura pseudoobscura TaxID=46245 RepID=A0A6I8W1B0_DROPS|nr:uncharacterized protein LOC26532134 isoform X2 [Drosophila pseudoobscura]
MAEVVLRSAFWLSFIKMMEDHKQLSCYMLRQSLCSTQIQSIQMIFKEFFPCFQKGGSHNVYILPGIEPSRESYLSAILNFPMAEVVLRSAFWLSFIKMMEDHKQLSCYMLRQSLCSTQIQSIQMIFKEKGGSHNVFILPGIEPSRESYLSAILNFPMAEVVLRSAFWLSFIKMMKDHKQLSCYMLRQSLCSTRIQ